MHRLGIPQDRIASRLDIARETVRDHLAKLAILPNPPNSDLKKGFTVSQTAENVTRNLISCNSQGYKSVYKQDIDPVHLDQGYYSYNLKLLCNKSI